MSPLPFISTSSISDHPYLLDPLKLETREYSQKTSYMMFINI